MSKPTFLTNDDEVTVAESLVSHLDWALENIAADRRIGALDVAIATAYFNPEGFRLLAPQLARVLEAGGTVRLLFGAEAVPAHRPPRRSDIPTLIDEATLTSRDRLGFTAAAGHDARSFTDWLRHDGVQARRLTSDFLHGKAYLVTTHQTSAVVGSSNFTYAGLSRNLELNLGAYDPDTVGRVIAWFERIWEQAEDYKDELLTIFEDRFVHYEPYDVYLRMLLERYGESLDEPEPVVPPKLTKFQIDGADRAERIMRKWGGVLVADGVGLGKTYVAGELLRRAEEERRQMTLVVAPRAVIAGWQKYKRNHGRSFDVISYEQLVEWDTAVAAGHVHRDRNRYALVVIDEAHAFRNDSTLRSEALHKLLAGRPRKHLVLLTATPVNNRLRDLEQLLGFFVTTKAAFVAQGIPNTADFFRDLEKQDPDALSPEALFPILDEIAVRRTRAFVKEFYPRETITIDGQQVAVSFPRAEVNPLRYALGAQEFFHRLDHAVTCSPAACADPTHDSTWPTLTMARYTPSRYSTATTIDSERLQREGNIAGLLLSGLLKRFESSIVAFERTCENMAAAHSSFLQALEAGWVLAGQDLAQFRQSVDDGQDPIEYLKNRPESEKSEPASDYRVEDLQAAVSADLDLLERFRSEIATIRAAGDKKVEQLLERLHEIDAEATNDDERKVLIFSAFSDTVEYLHVTLRDHDCDHADCPYRGARVAAVTGSDNRETIAEATSRFAPVSTEAVERSCADPAKRRGDVDLLIATDVLAEGVNLQQARHLINIDLPWNPMRIVQRHGRVSRIGSPHQRVILDCFFPDTDLEALLALEDRLRRKIAQANAGVGVEETPLPGAPGAGHVFSDDNFSPSDIIDLTRGKSGLLDRAERGTGGTSGEEFRRELVLRTSPEERDRIARLPAGVGSGRAAAVQQTTYLFCVKVAGQDRFAAVRSGHVVTTDTLEVLHAARCDEGTDRELRPDDEEDAYAAWELARAAVFTEWQPLTDSQTVRPKVPKVLREAVSLVRANAGLVGGHDKAADLISRLEGAYSSRIERQFRELARLELPSDEHVRRIAGLVEELDLQPYEEPTPLPKVQLDDVQLVAWMALVPQTELQTTQAGYPAT